MNDDFLDQIKSDWQQSETAELADLRRSLRRRRHWPLLLTVIEWLLAIVAVIAGVWLLFQATLLTTLSALVLLIPVPLLAWRAHRARSDLFSWIDATPLDVLGRAQLEVDTGLRLLRLAQWHAWGLLAFAGLLWILQWLGVLNDYDFLVSFSLIALLAWALTLAGCLWRRHRLLRQQQHIANMRETLTH